MILEKDLLEAIAECQGERNPNANTCIKLASYYTIYQQLYGNPTIEEVSYKSDSEFGNIIDKKDTYKVLEVMDEVMEAMQVLHPRLYAKTIERIKAI